MQYLLESAICLVVLYAFYHLVLRRETFFQLNRWYLILAALASFALPALNIRLAAPPAQIQAPEAVSEPVAIDLPQVVERMQVAPQRIGHVLEKPVWTLTLGTVLWWIYIAIAALLALRLLLQLVQMVRFLRQCRRENRDGITVATGPADTPLASFFGFVFWHPGDTDNAGQRLMFEHEMVHVRQWHSLDILFMELLIALQWFNPLLYLYRRSLREVHEYIADDYVVRRTRQHYQYATLLVRAQTTGNGAPTGLVNTFHSLIKNRLIMLAKHPSKPAHRAKYLLAVPLFAVLMLLFSFRLVERIPAASPLLNAVQNLEHYRSQLAEVVITADKPLQDEPTPYIFYWGAVQAKFYYRPDAKTYVAEMHIAPEEFKAAVQREPRLWTGETLLEQLSVQVGTIAVKSDYYKPEVYKSLQPELVSMAGELHAGDNFTIGNLRFPDGKTGRVQVFLDGKSPDWIPKSDLAAQVVTPELQLPRISDIYFGKTRFEPEEQRFVTADEFWQIIAAAPRLIFDDATESSPEKWNCALFNESGVVIRERADQKDALTLDQLRARLQDEKSKVKPGAKIMLSTWLDNDQKDHKTEADTVVTFDPVTYKENVMVVLAGGAMQFRALPSSLIALNIVDDTDPRRFLTPALQHSFSLEWGALKYKSNGYGLSFEAAGNPNRIFADGAQSYTNPNLTKNEILEMLRSQPKLSREGEVLGELGFTLKFGDQSWVIKNGELPAGLVGKLERDLQAGQTLTLTGFEAGGSETRHLAAPESTVTRNFNGKFAADHIDVLHLSDGKAFWGYTLSTTDFNKVREQLGNTPGVWFQHGETDLSRWTILLEVRNDDPKPPLRPVTIKTAAPDIRISASPNPAHERTTLNISLPASGNGTLRAFNAAGKELASLNTDFAMGESALPFSLETIKVNEPGTYFIRLEMPYGSASCKLVVN